MSPLSQCYVRSRAQLLLQVRPDDHDMIFPRRPWRNCDRCILHGIRLLWRWTLLRRLGEYGLENLSRFSIISEAEIDNLLKDFMSKHGNATGEPYLTGYLRALGYHIPRRKIRASINRVDPVNTALRWGALVSRRTYYVPWPNSLWHVDGHHSLIR